MTILPARIKNHLHSLYKKRECRDQQLLYLFLEITRKCNLCCKHCGSDCSAKITSRELTTSSWLKILEDIAYSFSPSPTIVLTGGEPILHADIGKITGKIKSLGMTWGLVSNGYCLDKESFESLRENGLHSITLSLDGVQDTHNWLRGKKGSFEKTVNAIRIISKSDIPYKDVVTCVNPKNLEDLDSIAQLLIETNMPSWRLFKIFPAGRAKGNRDLILSAHQSRKMFDWLTERRAPLMKRGLDVNLSCEGWLPFAEDIKMRRQPFFCRAGVNIASILCDGTITGCSNNSDIFFEGNILKDNFAYTWENKFQKFRDRNWVLNAVCGSCSHLKDCQGGSIHLWRDNLSKPESCYREYSEIV